MSGSRLGSEFFTRDVLKVAPDLLGKTLVRAWPDGRITSHTISETEAYRGTDDLACHARMGRTGRTEVMYARGGVLYMYLIYGMYWMLNVVTSVENVPQAVLIRSLSDVNGPGRLTRKLGLDKSFNGESLVSSGRIWLQDTPGKVSFTTHQRIGIDYAGDYWKSRPWRFLMSEPEKQ